jgi:uncharacterized protein (DUF885 family)
MDRRTMMIGASAAALTGRNALSATLDDDRPQSLRALLDEFVGEDLDISPERVSSLGLDSGRRARQKRELDDCSLAGIETQKQLTASQLRRLQAVNRSKLSAADLVTYNVVLYGLRASDEANRAFDYGPGGAGAPYVISQLTGCYQDTPPFLDSDHTIESEADADAYLVRLAAFAAQLNQEVDVARHDMGLGVIPPDFVLEKTLSQMQAMRAASPEASSLTDSVVRRTLKQKISGDFRRLAAQIVRQKVYPALDAQMAVVRDMRKVATHAAGVSRLPRGADYYSASLDFWTTTRKPATEIHQLGLEIIKEQSAQIDGFMRKISMTDGTVGSRLNAMYKDPKLLYENTDADKAALIADLNKRVQRVQAQLASYFGTLPKAQVEIRRIPKELEAGATIGRYDAASLDGTRPGIYWINLRDTRELPKWQLPTLTYHESIPGHHLQRSIQQEAELPMIRKMGFYGAYTEGWALYAEQLAVEMGEYANDPLGHIGQLQASMQRAVRLVVDSGLHGMNWSREQSIRYFTETLGSPEAPSITEVERYCVWPGQACSYMLGKLAFLAQRNKARIARGGSFDIRQFHDSVLLAGAVPLGVLEQIDG